jgi:hypothetical protein
MVSLQEVMRDVEEFCSSTSIQGLRNVTDHKQGCFLRVLWLILVTVSFILSGICIKESIDGKELKLTGFIERSRCRFASIQYKEFPLCPSYQRIREYR